MGPFDSATAFRMTSTACGHAPESGPITTGDPSVIKDPNRWLIRSPREYG
jgi:hypothetical protein